MGQKSVVVESEFEEHVRQILNGNILDPRESAAFLFKHAMRYGVLFSSEDVVALEVYDEKRLGSEPAKVVRLYLRGGVEVRIWSNGAAVYWGERL